MVQTNKSINEFTFEESKIPVKNLFYMYCYALNFIDLKKEISNFSTDKMTNFESLLAMLYISIAKRLRHCGHEGAYQELEEDSSELKGSINFTKSISHLIKRNGKLNCNFDSFSYNHLKNQLIKSIGVTIARSHISPSLRFEIQSELEVISDVDLCEIDENALASLIKFEKNSNYKKMLNLCLIVFKCSILSTEEKDQELFNILVKAKPSKIYESFLRNFYKTHLSKFPEKFEVKNGERGITSSLEVIGDANSVLLPIMRSDIFIESNDTVFILDAKFYEQTFTKYYEVKKLRSGHIYQIEAYVNHIYLTEKISKKIRGILIYPKIDDDIWFCAKNKQGHFIEAVTVDLSQNWDLIEQRLKEIIFTYR